MVQQGLVSKLLMNKYFKVEKFEIPDLKGPLKKFVIFDCVDGADGLLEELLAALEAAAEAASWLAEEGPLQSWS